MKYCLIGEKLGHSYSKVIHEKFGLNYDLVEIKKEELDSFFKNCEFSGFNVTIPYKKDVIKYLSYLSPIAESAGAVNTVVNKSGKFYGYNTDVDGMNYMIKRAGVTLTDKNVMILGSGGTSNTAITLCKRERAKSITVVSRNGEVNYENCYNYKDTEIIINATPVGMFPKVYGKPIDLAPFKKLQGVFDCIYNPQNTELISEAKALNIACESGLSMLVEQALLARDIWLETTHDYTVTEKIIKEIRKLTSNIVLCGMPSAGKTTVGKILSEKLGLNFYDSDEEITKAYNKTPSEIINSQGEKAFRDIESEVIKELSIKSGGVISLGGGAILREENVKNLKRNGTIVYIKRDLDKLIDTNRPLSQKQGIKDLYEKRKDIYNKVSDLIVENNGAVEECAKKVIEEYETTCN